MIYPDRSQAENSDDDSGRDDDVEYTAYGELIEVLPAPGSVLGDRQSSLLDQSHEPEPSVRAAVGARLYPRPGLMVEYVEASSVNDDSLNVYEDTVWVRRRVVRGSLIKVWLVITTVIFCAALTAAMIIPWSWFIPMVLIAIAAIGLCTLGLLRLAIHVGPWLRLDKSYWLNLISVIQVWDKRDGVAQHHLVARLDAAINDAGVVD